MKNRLSTQIVLLNLTMIGILALAISGSLAYLIQTNIQDINDEWGASFTASLGESIATATINGNAVQARQNILEVLSRSKSISYIYVTNFENQLFVHSFDSDMPKQILSRIQQYNANPSLANEPNRHVELTLGGVEIREYQYPLIEGLSASVFIGINADETSQVIFTTLIDIVLITLAAMLISILVSLLTSKRIAKPLETFNKRIIDYGKTGKLNEAKQADFHHIEIEQLNDSFNQLVAARSQAESELKQYQQKLEHLVDERTQELRNAQDELVRKERLATLGNLTATVSHELRNPLGSMRPSLYVIETVTYDDKNEKLQAAIQRLYRSIDRCDRIIDELLDFTRITDLSLQTVILDDWLDEVIHEQPLLSGIELIYQPHSDNTQVVIDPDRMRRAIINVFENACHAMLVGGSTTEVIDNAKLSIHTQIANNRVNISINDSGGGIPDELKEKIFEPLFSTKGFGVGLGMPTIRQIMKQHKGGIDIDTGPKGTTVTLWLALES